MKHHPSHEALEAMEKYGGSFVRSLADCYLRADPSNRERLAIAFPDFYGRYEDVARQIKLRDEARRQCT